MSENEEQQPPSPPALRPPTEPAPLDPEHVRQFQEFKQFQELMRQNDGVPPKMLPPAKKPLWKKILRSKIVRRLIYLLIILLLLSWAYQHYFGTTRDDLPASITGGGRTDTNLVLETNPYATVQSVYHFIAQDTPVQACGRFTNDAAQQFAQHFQSADCAAAIANLTLRVTNKNDYTEVDFHGKMGQVPSENSIEISSCDLGVTAGPRLGAFTVQRIKLDQWIITAHRIESC